MDLNLFDNIDFDKAEDLFDSYINSCDIIKHEYVTPSNLVISTITVTGGIGTLVNDEIIYNCLKINDKIIYLEKGSRIRGNKPLKKKKRVKKEIGDPRFKKIDKRKRGKGKSFSNQVSIGVEGILDMHKKPINVKLFKNGRIHMAGARSLEEAEAIYNIVVEEISKISLKHPIQGTDRIVNIYPIENINPYSESGLKINMINSTFQTNFKIEQLKLYNLLKTKYDITEVFTTYNNCMSSPIRVYLKCYATYDSKKKKFKQPSLFIYRSGSVNVVVPRMELLDKAYKFINTFFKENYNEIVQKDIDLESTNLNIKI
jgi:hypothetical protein